ncbi:unnamed protein product [Ilex paraguariensis]|uniref:Uncharacterized protein n=1 Tax=Ilex paraguariensis TaxID=185542 RepID=A0ABC8T005_9AQUA
MVEGWVAIVDACVHRENNVVVGGDGGNNCVVVVGSALVLWMRRGRGWRRKGVQCLVGARGDWMVKHVDCCTIKIHELESVTTRYKFQSMMRAPFHGFAFWFDVEFNGPPLCPTNNGALLSLFESSNDHPSNGSQRKKRANPNEALVLSTAPEDPPTHWQQVP